jgi:proteic killer suppression protein
MITTFGDKATALLFRGSFVRSLPTQIQRIVYRKLLMIDAAASIEDLYTPPGNRLESLQGQRSGNGASALTRSGVSAFTSWTVRR